MCIHFFKYVPYYELHTHASLQRYWCYCAALTWCNKAATHIYTCRVSTVSTAVENASYPTAVHAQSGVK